MLEFPIEGVYRMPKNDVYALNASFQRWQKSRFPNPPKGFNVFEYFCIEQFARSFDLGDSQIKAGIVGQGQDGGVDAFYIFANGEMVDEGTEIDLKDDPPAFRLLIMQVKSEEGFSPVAVDKLYWFTDDLLDLSRKKADYHSTYHADLIAAMRVFKDKFGQVVEKRPPLAIDYIYVVKKDVKPNEDCVKSSKTVIARCKHHFRQVQSDFRFVNATALYKQVEARPPSKKTLKWASQPMSTQEGEIGLVKLKDYFSFIKEQDGKIAERLFDSNVRGYWPSSHINKRIAETLKSPTSPEFWLLNNGITILTEKTVAATGLEIDVHDPQIVNGLQTSRQIYNHFSTAQRNDGKDKRRVLVRIIRTVDKTTRDDVIRCTNSQNEMPEEALRATDAIHRQLEQAFHLSDLYYDRRKGHYRDQKKPVNNIVSVIDVLQSMVSIVLQRPDDARARPRDYIKNTAQYNSVFGADLYSLALYVKATELCRRVEDFLDSKAVDSIHRRNVYFYLCMYASCEMTKNGHADPGAIQKIDLAEVSDQILEKCYQHVFKQYDKLATAEQDPDGEKEYDSIAKGPRLLKALQAETRRRFNKKRKS